MGQILPILMLIVFIFFIMYLINPEGFPPAGMQESMVFIKANFTDIALVVAILCIVIIVFIVSEIDINKNGYNREATINFEHEKVEKKGKQSVKPSTMNMNGVKDHYNEIVNGEKPKSHDAKEGMKLANLQNLTNRLFNKVSASEMCEDGVCNNSYVAKNNINYSKKTPYLNRMVPFKNVDGNNMVIDVPTSVNDRDYFKKKSGLFLANPS